MSDDSALKALLARLGPGPAAAPARSSSEPATLVLLRRTGALDRPVDVARRLRACGLSLREAHGAISALAESWWAVVAVAADTDFAALAVDLRPLNVELRRRRDDPAALPDIAAVRARHRLSQREFAALLGFDLRTLQNWEQGRNRPDRAALSLVALFDRDPEAIEALMSEPVLPAG